MTREEILNQGRTDQFGSAQLQWIGRLNKCVKILSWLDCHSQVSQLVLSYSAEKEHPHFICRVCEKVFDLDIPMRLPKVTLPDGFHLFGGEVVYSELARSVTAKQLKLAE